MSHDDHNLPDDVETLKAMIAQHVTTITQHESVITQHVETLTQREAVIAAQHDTIDHQLMELERLQRQIEKLLRRQYGPQKERIDPSQLTLFTIEELEQLASELRTGVVDSVPVDDGSEASSDDANGDADSSAQNDDGTSSGTQNADNTASDSKPKRSGHGRRTLPENLPRETIVHELTDEERTCPCCGKLLKTIGTEVSRQLEFIPAHLKVIEHLLTKYACDDCEENVAIATKPPQPIAKGLPGPGLVAHVVLSKYGDYLPLYRQEDSLARCGIILRRSTLCDLIACAADLVKPLYDLMCARVCQSRVIHTDDTGIKMLEKLQCRNCKFWTYVGDEQHPYAVYEFSLTREGKNPSRFLEHFSGYLQADAFSGYHESYGTGKAIEVACMAHCRRYWWEAKDTDSRRALEALSYISRLYELEVQFDTAELKGDASSRCTSETRAADSECL
jgi:transposase